MFVDIYYFVYKPLKETILSLLSANTNSCYHKKKKKKHETPLNINIVKTKLYLCLMWYPYFFLYKREFTLKDLPVYLF